jgi:putative membrane protein
MWPGHMSGNWWMWMIGGLMMLLFWGGVIALVVLAIRAVGRPGRMESEQQMPFHQKGNATDILKERYARGEITRDEYLSMRRDLEE